MGNSIVIKDVLEHNLKHTARGIPPATSRLSALVAHPSLTGLA